MEQNLSQQSRDLVVSKILGFHDLSKNEQVLEIIKVVAADFYLFAERNLQILDKLSGAIVPFKMNWAQKKLVDTVLDDIAHNRPVRYIILKARQMGFSTVIEALGYWWTTTHKNIKSVVMAHEEDASVNLYNMFKRYFENCNWRYQPLRKYNTQKGLYFDSEDKEKDSIKAHVASCATPESCGQSHKIRGLGSSIKTLVAKDGKGRSSTIHFFHGSEVAFWKANADVVSSAVQAVPMAPGTFVFLESTANGVGGYFYDEWQSAKKGESNLKPLFFAWHEHDEYEIEGVIGSGYDDEEKTLLELFKESGYPKSSWDRKVLWRRAKKKEFRTDPQKFYQEYPKDDMEAFLASGRPVFDIDQLLLMERFSKTYKPMYGAIIVDETGMSNKYMFDEIVSSYEGQEPSPLKVWELPEKGVKYVIGVDVSEGKLNIESSKKQNDYSVVDVMRIDTLKTVARWRGHIDPDLLGSVVFKIGTFYNKALVGVEVNNHGLTTVQSLRNKNYMNLYMRKTSEEQSFQTRTSLMGFRTDRKTKPIIINNLVQAIRDGDIIDLDIVFIRECMTYVRDDDGHTNAQSGQFDDTVMAKAIALKLSDYNSMNASELRESINKPNKRRANATTEHDFEFIATGRSRRSNPFKEAIQRRKKARATYKNQRR